MNQEEVLGFIFGACEDGCIYRTKKNEWIVEYEQKYIEWLQLVQQSLQLCGYKSSIRKTNKGYFRLTCYSKELYNKIAEFRQNRYALTAKSQEFQIGFVRGMFDAEGSVNKSRFQISLYSKNKELILEINKILENLGLKTGKISNTRDVLILPIYGKEEIKKFYDCVGFRHIPKMLKLNRLLEQKTPFRTLKTELSSARVHLYESLV